MEYLDFSLKGRFVNLVLPQICYLLCSTDKQQKTQTAMCNRQRRKPPIPVIIDQRQEKNISSCAVAEK